MLTTPLMINLEKYGEEEVESFSLFECPTSWEIFPIYRAWFANLLVILGIKSLNFEDKRDKISSSL